MGSLLPSFSLETWIFIIAFLSLFMLYGIWPYSFFKKLGIPGPMPLPFIGTFHEYRNGVVAFDQKCYLKYGKIWGIFDGRQPVMAIMDPTMIKTILVKEFYTSFTNHQDFGLNGELDTALMVVMDEQWKRIRNVLSPTFTSGRLKEMLPIINHYGDVLVRNVQKKVDSGDPIGMKDIFGAYSMDVITSTSFSVDIDSLNNPNDPFVTHVKKFLKLTLFNPLLVLVVLFPFLAKPMNKLGVTLIPLSFISFFTNALRKIKEDRQKNNHTNRVDFLQLMVDSQISGDVSDEANAYKALTDKEIFTQAIFFIFAGYETSSTSLSFMSYCLATHPDVQQRLQDEIDEVLPNQATPTYDAIFQMEYLDMVVNETLRMYPPVGRLDRACKKTVEINGVTIPKGTVAMIPVYVLHHDPQYWPEPEEFRPERFSKENRETFNPYTFLPFGAGPRNCIGMRFALLVLKIAMVVLLQKFSFRTCKETPIPLELDSMGFIQPKKPIMLKMVPRARTESEE
ncbi:cytochrome P450 3A24-like [Hemicordylus capensis]|uniref:cytochrome P450 3A24-like n=1 Tax=Hemicordylus capensis TaxID=884348 RepID=UPI002303C6A9|nr:cytochrome P450 3A24-like [Hemicordylus capensis]